MENNSRYLCIHYFVRAAILMGFAVLISQLVKSGDIQFYIAPRMVVFVKYSALVLYVAAIYQVYVAFQALWGRIETCACQPIPSRSILWNGAVYGLFVMPLLLGFLLPHVTLGSAVAAKKGVNLSSASQVRVSEELQIRQAEQRLAAAAAAQVPEQTGVLEADPVREAAEDGAEAGPSGEAPGSNPAPAPPSPPSAPPVNGAASQQPGHSDKLDELFPHDRYTEHYAKHGMKLYQQDVIKIPEEFFIESMTTMDLYQDPFQGKRMELHGFVFRTEQMSASQFVVARFAIQCCAADAAPYGMLVQFDNALSFKDDDWVHVTGTISRTVFNDFDILLLKVEEARKIPEPDTPYVYMNYDFGLED